MLAIVPLARLRADVAAAPAWRLSSGVTTALVQGGTVYVGGTFTQLFTPSSSQDQFYDLLTGQPRTQCARSTSATRQLRGTPDGFGGLLVVVQDGDTFADANGDFAPPPGTTIVRVAETCLWDRQFAAPSIDPSAPSDLNVGLPVRVGNVVYAANSIVDGQGFLRAQVAAFAASTGSRLTFRFYSDTAEIGLLGTGPQGPVARVRARTALIGQYVLGAVTQVSLDLVTSSTPLADEIQSPETWVRGTTLYRARPAPASTLEAYDLSTLQPKSGWAAPVVPALSDLEVVGNRVFLTAGRVNGQAVPQPSALLASTGAVDATWAPPVLTKPSTDSSGTPYTPVLTELATDGTRLYFSGDMERVGGIDRDGAAALLAGSGTLDTWTIAPLLASPLEYTPSGLLMTRPSGANRVTRRYLAAIDKATGIATPWNPNDTTRLLMHVASPVSALAADGTWLYFASATTGEIQRASLATGDVDQGWRFVVTRGGGQVGSIAAMALDSGTLYIGGVFDTISGVGIGSATRRVVAAVGTDGALRPWAPLLDGPDGVTLLDALMVLDHTVYLAGGFGAVNSQFRLGFAAVDGGTGALVQPELFVLGETRIRGLATDGARIFVAGQSYGAPFIGAWTPQTAQFESFQVQNAVVPTSAAFAGGRLYAGLEYDTEARAATSRTTTWNTVVSGPDALVHVLSADGTVEYYVAQPGVVPGAPTLSGSVSGAIVALAWTPDPAGGSVSSYVLQVGSVSGASDIATFPMGKATSFTTPAPNGGYYVRIVPRNSFGPGPASNELFLRVGPPPCTLPPPTPNPLTFTKAGFGVTLSWGLSDTAAGYVLEAGSAPGLANLANAPVGNITSYATPAPAGTYYVRVRAVSACGVSAPTNEVVVTLDGSVPLPETPGGLAATVTGHDVIIRWTPASGGGTAAGYQFEAGYAPGLANAAVVLTAAPSLAAPGVPAGTYYVRVRAVNAAGASPPTADITVVVP